MQQVHQGNKGFCQLNIQVGNRFLYIVTDVMIGRTPYIDVVADPDKALFGALWIQAREQQALVADIAKLLDARLLATLPAPEWPVARTRRCWASADMG